MSNTAKAFEKGKALIPFVTAGDPNLEVTKQVILAMEKAGADLIQIGIPFSDPVAEGLTIARADSRSLSNGTTTDKIFDMLADLRKESNVPLVFVTYINPVFVYGADKFCKKCADVNIDAVMVPDTPYEEKGEILPYCEKYGIDLVSYIAPISTSRIEMIAKEAQGFVYCITPMCETEKDAISVTDMTSLARQHTNVPIVAGFEVSTPEQVKEVAEYADGVVIDSAVGEFCEKYGENSPEYVYEYIKTMKEALI